MATIAAGAWIFIMGGAIANIALPHLAAELDVPEADVVWITIAFQLAAVCCTIPLAGVAEVVGVRRVYVGGLVIYAAGAVACGLSAGFAQLVLARAVQGLGAAAMSSVNVALLRRIVPDRMMGRGLALMALAVGAAQGAAPILGSAILELAPWRVLFFYDTPLAVAAAALALLSIPRDRIAAHRFDYVSAALCVPAFGLLALSFDRIGRAPADPASLAILATGLAALAALVLRQRGRERPLFPVDLFRLPRFTIPAVLGVALFAAQGITLAAMPFLLVRSLGLSLIEAGALISVMPLATLVTAVFAGVLADRLPRIPFSALGAAVTALGYVAILAGAERNQQTLLVAALVLAGAAFAFFHNHNSKTMILSAPLSRVTAAGGIQSTVRVVGMMVGPSIVGICFHLFGPQGAEMSILAAALLAAAGAALGFVYTWISSGGAGGAAA